MTDILRRAKPIPVPRGGFTSNEEEARWLTDTIAMRMQEALIAIGVQATVPTASLRELLIFSLDSASKRAYVRAQENASGEVALKYFCLMALNLNELVYVD